jgi:ABC-type nitrate/sulfonate/bicarbonate transport system ATPase subunit
MTGIAVAIRSKCYAGGAGPQRLVLDNVRFDLPTGEFTCIVGPSGCGKTTLLNIIGGTDRAVDGTVVGPGLSDARRPRAARVFQTPRLMPWLTVLDNVRLVLPDSGDLAREMLGTLGLGDFLHAYPRALSGGMQRRVALARALAVRPQLLLLDEPFVSLDRPATLELRRLLLDLWRRHGMTVVFVTHDLEEALALGDRVLFLSSDPARIILDLPVALPRARRDEAALAGLARDLLRRFPNLLAGRAP